ncbi:MAG: hypothetical protein IPP94_07600 [Ignavibacteria bacterium]|nr:hypothetical protein [Ignavibacteria bacterium]
MTLFSGMSAIRSIAEKCVEKARNAEIFDFSCVFNEKVRKARTDSNPRIEKNRTFGNLKNHGGGLHLRFEESTFLIGGMVASVPSGNTAVSHQRPGFLKGGFIYNAAPAVSQATPSLQTASAPFIPPCTGQGMFRQTG